MCFQRKKVKKSIFWLFNSFLNFFLKFCFFENSNFEEKKFYQKTNPFSKKNFFKHILKFWRIRIKFLKKSVFPKKYSKNVFLKGCCPFKKPIPKNRSFMLIWLFWPCVPRVLTLLFRTNRYNMVLGNFSEIFRPGTSGKYGFTF